VLLLEHTPPPIVQHAHVESYTTILALQEFPEKSTLVTSLTLESWISYTDRQAIVTMASPNLQEVQDTLISIARKAGEMITSAHPSTGGSGIKKNCACMRCLCSQVWDCVVSMACQL